VRGCVTPSERAAPRVTFLLEARGSTFRHPIGAFRAPAVLVCGAASRNTTSGRTSAIRRGGAGSSEWAAPYRCERRQGVPALDFRLTESKETASGETINCQLADGKLSFSVSISRVKSQLLLKMVAWGMAWGTATFCEEARWLCPNDSESIGPVFVQHPAALLL